MSTQPPAPGADEARLLRWADAGGTWHVVEMERFDSSDPALIERLSADGPGGLEGCAEPAPEEGA